MRFPFFSIRRKSAELLPKKSKKGTLCCIQTTTDDAPVDARNLGSDVTTILHGSISSASSKSTQYSTTVSVPSLGEKTSHFISVKAHTPDDTLQKIVLPPIQTFQRNQGTGTTSETEESDAISQKCDQENGMTRWRRMKRSLSSPKGPGLGSIFDNPPTRMLHEKARTNFSEYARTQQQQRRQSTDVQPPELPTRLEVCSEDLRRRSMPCRIGIEATARQCRQESTLSSIMSDSVSREESFLTQRRSSSSSMLHEKHSSDSLTSDASTRSSSSKRSARTQSPADISSQSSDSMFRDVSVNQQTNQQQQSLETTRHMNQYAVVARREVEEKPNVYMNNSYKPASMHSSPADRLRELHIGIRLKWISEREDDLVTEVYMTDFQQEDERTEARADPRRKSEDLRLYEKNRRKNQMNLVARVDRILSELQRQKRSRTRNKKRTELAVAVAVDSSKKIINKTHGRQSQTRKQDTAAGTENYRGNCGPVQRTQRRREILQAFEVLISRMEEKVATLDESFAEDESLLTEKSLAGIVLFQLRKEVSRLENGLREIESFAEIEVAAARTPWTAPEPTSSRIANNFVQEKVGEVVDEAGVPGWRGSQFDQVASTSHSQRVMNGSIPEQRSLSSYLERSSLPRSYRDSRVQGRRLGMDGRTSNNALHNGDMFFVQGADMENRMARVAMW